MPTINNKKINNNGNNNNNNNMKKKGNKTTTDNLDNTSILDKINLEAAIALGLRPSLFHKQMYLYFLLARYFIWICKTQGKAPKLENFLSFSTLFL